jgi:hypothetical protein
VSNPLDAAALTVADHHTEIKVGSKGRLRSRRQAFKMSDASPSTYSEVWFYFR